MRKICLLLGRRKLGKDENAQKLYEDMKKEVTGEERVRFGKCQQLQTWRVKAEEINDNFSCFL